MGACYVGAVGHVMWTQSWQCHRPGIAASAGSSGRTGIIGKSFCLLVCLPSFFIFFKSGTLLFGFWDIWTCFGYPFLGFFFSQSLVYDTNMFVKGNASPIFEKLGQENVSFCEPLSESGPSPWDTQCSGALGDTWEAPEACSQAPGLVSRKTISNKGIGCDRSRGAPRKFGLFHGIKRRLMIHLITMIIMILYQERSGWQVKLRKALWHLANKARQIPA